jgi:hypothetical protein
MAIEYQVINYGRVSIVQGYSTKKTDKPVNAKSMEANIKV